MDRQQKSDTVEELKETLGKVASLVVTDYRGLSVEQVNGLRSEIRKADCQYRVVKNTLFRRAIAGTTMEGLASLFTGPTSIAYSYEDPVAPAKIVDKFDKDLPELEVKGAYLDGEVIDKAGVASLAKMLGKDELRAKLLMLFLAPATEFVRQIAAAPQNFVHLLAARERSLEE